MQNDNNNEKTNIGDKINNFIQKNRKAIFVTFIIFVLIFAGFVSYFLISESMDKKAIAEVEELNEEFARLRFFINEDFFQEDVNNLIAKLEAFVKNKRGFAGSKAWSIIANIHSDRKDWLKAEEAWVNSANVGSKTYLSPIAFFNASVAAEEQGKLDQAIIYLQQCISHNFEFPDAPRAQFNIGRLYEQLGNFQRALESYRAVLINFQWDRSDYLSSNMFIWQNLARNQIIKLELR